MPSRPHVLHVVGARPNFMKVAPVLSALRERDTRQTLVHTGQHYDVNLSDVIFRELGLPEPDVNLGVGSGSHGRQTAQVLVGMEEVITERKPDWVLVYGDVNSTLAAALAAAKLEVPVAHVEAGLRSGDRAMPEEINRILTDRLARLLFTPSEDGDRHLLSEGVEPSWIKRVGNVMIDTLTRLLPLADPERVMERLALPRGPFVLITLHRPSNVDDPYQLVRLIDTLVTIADDVPVVFPMHPRTRARVAAAGLATGALTILEPLSYLDFLALQRRAAAVVTDSGGIQEETTYLGVPCLTVRENTERPVTVTEGTNELVGRDMGRLKDAVREILNGTRRSGRVPELWDGCAGERIAAVLCT